MVAALALNATPAHANKEADAAGIETMVQSVGSLADTGNFTALEKLFADEVMMDYSSLSGEAATIKSPQTIMTEWAAVLPGFDRTRHAISNIKTDIDGATATATADVTAGHWIDDAYWEVEGRYSYAFEHDAGAWAVTAMTFTLDGETGSREVFGPAMAAASAEPADYIIRQQAHQVILDFLIGLEEKDMEKVNNVWADDAVQDMPYTPEGFSGRIIGKEALINQYAAWPENSGEANFTDGIVFYPMLDPQTVIVEYRGVSQIIPTGRIYDQKYIGVFNVVDGKIQLFREYFNPNVFADAFGLNEGGSFFQE